MESGRAYQLPQERGVSPNASLESIMAFASRSKRIVCSLPNAAARCSGVSPLVRQSRMKPPVSIPSAVVTFGSAPCDRRTWRTRSCDARSVVHRAAWSGVSKVSGSGWFGFAPCSSRNWQRRQCPWNDAALRSRFSPRADMDSPWVRRNLMALTSP
jgi:hypothetical protein